MYVRFATREDIQTIAEVSRELAHHVDEPDPGHSVTALDENCFGEERWSDCIVVVDNSAVLGFALFCRQFEAHTRQRSLWLSDLAVTEGYRNLGVGKMLVNFLIGHAAEHNCNVIKLELWRENANAEPFYKSIGAKWDREVDLLRIPVLTE